MTVSARFRAPTLRTFTLPVYEVEVGRPDDLISERLKFCHVRTVLPHTRWQALEREYGCEHVREIIAGRRVETALDARETEDRQRCADVGISLSDELSDAACLSRKLGSGAGRAG
jgi:hypothetical protein